MPAVGSVDRVVVAVGSALPVVAHEHCTPCGSVALERCLKIIKMNGQGGKRFF